MGIVPAEQAICQSCGCLAFEVAGEDDDPERFHGQEGSFELTGSGAIIRIHGTVVCWECGDPVALPQLSIVGDAIGDTELLELKAQATASELDRVQTSPDA